MQLNAIDCLGGMIESETDSRLFLYLSLFLKELPMPLRIVRLQIEIANRDLKRGSKTWTMQAWDTRNRRDRDRQKTQCQQHVYSDRNQRRGSRRMIHLNCFTYGQKGYMYEWDEEGTTHWYDPTVCTVPVTDRSAPRKRRDITEVYYRKSMKHSRAMHCMKIFSLSFVLLLHISWSEQKQISLSFSFSRLILRHPSAALIPISAARRSSSPEKHRRLDFNAARALSFNFSRSRLLFPKCFKSRRSTDLQHLPSQSSSVCSVKSNEAWQSEMKER